MAESVHISSTTKEGKYNEMLPQIESLIAYESDLVANLANVTAVLKEVFDFFWVGFYLVKNEELVLGPFQGPLACTRIFLGKGVCGKAWEDKKFILVPDVDQFDGHIACSSASKSEVVVPVFNKDNEVMMILDVDSDQFNDFNQDDVDGLTKLATIISNKYS